MSVLGCGPTSTVTPLPPVAPPPPPESRKIIVLRFENATKPNKADTSTGMDRLVGTGIRAQIVKALEQTGRFTIGTNSGPREVLQRGMLTAAGELNARVKERLGSFGDAEFLVAGAVTTYQLSKESKTAGIEADLLFGETHASGIALGGIVDTAKREFNNARPAAVDRVAFELWVFDAQAGKLLASTTIAGTPSESGETIGGPFGHHLATAPSETATPMQRALRGGAIKAVNWIAETQDAFRAGTLIPPALPVVRKTLRPPATGKSSRVGGKTPANPAKTAENVPVTAAPPKSEEDWGSPSSQPRDGGAKAPPRDSEEWGEK